MKIQLLGTGGADGIPSFYSDDPVTRYAREHGGKDIRTRCAALVDDSIKLDHGPDTLYQIHKLHLNPRDWSALLFTHSDADHFLVEELQYAVHPFTEEDCPGFTIFANPTICGIIHDRYPDWPFDIVETQNFASYPFGEYTFRTFEANHKPGEDCHNWMISDDRVNLLYAADTGWWNEATWAALQGHRLDALVIECTEGLVPSTYEGHLDIVECVAVIDRLRSMNVVRPDTKVVTTHHAHYGGATHDQLVNALSPHGIDVGYDGLTVEF